jgi:pimeloyl-ACP methyl ester carboxylesterase
MASQIIPEPWGPHAVSVHNYQLVDSTRSELFPSGTNPRSFMITAWYPTHGIGDRAHYVSANPWNDMVISSTMASGLGDLYVAVNMAAKRVPAVVDGPPIPGPDSSNGFLPTVLFSPGLGMPRFTQSLLAVELASYGYLVITIDHVYETLIVETPQGLKSRYKADQDDWFWRTVLDTRIGDIQTVLDQMTNLPGIGPVASSPVAVIGHSYGAFAALMAAAVDSRISSVVALDGPAGWPIGDEIVAPYGLPVDTLSLSLQEDMDAAILMPGWATMLDHPGEGTLYDLRVYGAKHMAFTDVAMLAAFKRASLVGSIQGSRAVFLTRTYVREFLDNQLRDLHAQPLPAKFTQKDPAWPEVWVH